VQLSTPLRPDAGLRALVREIAPAGAPARGRRSRLTPLLWATAAGLAALVLARSGDSFLRAFERALHTGWQLVALAALLEAASLAGYVVLLHRVVARADRGLRLKDSYDIALGGTAATRLLPTAGLGGAAVTVWALRARGMGSRELTERLLAFFVILYAVYVAALLGCGVAIGTGLVHVTSGSALGVIGAGLALAIATAVLTLLANPALTASLLRRAAGGGGRLAPSLERIHAQLPVLHDSLERVARELRRPHPALLGAVASWGFDIGVLILMLHAFGAGLPVPAIVLAYFLGSLFNLLPLPGSLSGGLAGVLIALGAPAAGALAAVMAYRALAVWLPAASGISSLFALRASVNGWRAERAVSRTTARQPAV
jgi:uncharacterized membrane protein YbhN (UPF0104 family)